MNAKQPAHLTGSVDQECTISAHISLALCESMGYSPTQDRKSYLAQSLERLVKDDSSHPLTAGI